MADRPAGAPPAWLTVGCGAQTVAALVPGLGFRVILVPLPAGCIAADDRTLVLRAGAWSPAENGGTDWRDLGVRVDWVVFLPATEETDGP